MMDSARWQKVQAFFHEALELPEAQRRGFLEAQCQDDPGLVGEVLVLLDEDARGDSLLDRDIAQAADQVFNEPDATSLPFKEFGPYRIIRELGEGGMGVVYLAARMDLGNMVALKILREAWASPARRQRFESEQRTLAKLIHPSIARLYDAGTLSDGTPWFVMEYVDGVPLTEYCRERDCTVEERLKLFRAVCEAVEYAHQHGVIHRDLKPSNILVRADGAVRLLDFGIAKQIDAGTQASKLTRTGMHLLTPAYASPEQIRGEAVGVASDVYSLGVILYELLAGRLPFDVTEKTPAEAANLIVMEDPVKPSAIVRRSSGKGATRTGSWADLDVLCLTAMHKEQRRRYASVKALVGDLDHYLKHEPLEAHPDSPAYVAAKFLRRNWVAVSVAAMVAALLLFVGSLALTLRRNGTAVTARPRTVAVLPFANSGSDHSMDFLGTAIPEEIARVLGHARSLTVRPFDASRAQTDPRKAARELGVTSVVTGHFVKEGDHLQVAIDALDIETSHYLWRDAFIIPAANTIRLQGEIASRTRNGLGPNLGAREFTLASMLRWDMVLESASRPKNPQAYDLFLRAMGTPEDPGSIKKSRAMLEQSVALDPGYAPAWAALASVCTGDSWYGGGGAEAAQCAANATKHAAALDPDNVWTLVPLLGLERNQIATAYRGAADLVRRRPENSDAHFYLSYALRYAGLLEESESECNTGLLLDPQYPGLRSCAVAFLLHGDYQRARDFLRLDLGSQFEKALSMDVLLREGKEKEALEARPATAPDWAGFPILFAYLEHRPAGEIAALARAMKPVNDPEMNYFSAAHLAYAGQPEAALRMLRAAITGGYCAYPAIESDPMLAGIRSNAAFEELSALARQCREQFMAARKQ
jgi:TolB-like protein/predicted Ser/Thr protein kinase/tetratricopeptide (TPR) repeat protein